MTTDTYNVLNLGLQALISIAMIATFVVYFLQLRAMQRGATGQNILALVNYLQAEHVRAARTTVRATLKTKPYSEWSAGEKRDAALVCSTYDVAAILILDQKLVPPEPFISNWGPSICDCYEVCQPHISELQRPENSGSAYWNDFERLYERSKAVIAAQHPLAAGGGR